MLVNTRSGPRNREKLLAVVACLSVACRGGKGTPSPAPSGSPADGLPNPLPEIAARVNGHPIYSLSVASRARELMVREVVAKEKKAEAFRQALEELIAREVLLQEATARRISADEKAVESAYDEARVPFKDDSSWEKLLRDKGLDAQSFRVELRAKYTIEALQRAEAEKVKPVSDEEARAFYDANPSVFDQVEPVRVRHIMIRKRGGIPETWANDKSRIKAILERIRAGDDFAALAKQYSEDPASKEKGGELPAFVRGQMLKPFEDVVYSLKPGQVSDVFETPLGFHVARLEERLPPKSVPYEEAREDLKIQLLQQKREAAAQSLTDALKAKARVERFL